MSPSEGRFKQIEVWVKNTPFEVSDRFRIIDIPGERRTIKRIDFNYKSLNRRKQRHCRSARALGANAHWLGRSESTKGKSIRIPRITALRQRVAP
jgi:hypothetical protein